MTNIVDLRKKQVPPEPQPMPPRTLPVSRTAKAPAPARPAEEAELPAETAAAAPALDRPLVQWQAVMHQGIHWEQMVRLVSVIVLAGLAIGYFQRDFVALAFLGLMLLVLFLHRHRKSELTAIEASEHSIAIEDAVFHHRDTKSFWIEYNPGGLKELSLELRRWYAPHMKIPLGDQDPTQLHALLSSVLPEEEHPISLIDTLFRRPHHK